MIRVPPAHLPIIFVISCAVSSFLGIGVMAWGFPIWPLLAAPYVGGMTYLLVLAWRQWPELQRDRHEARRRDRATPIR
ncbi:MAG: hypothetical protein QOG09_1862 [Solirubrobacterales bacterium]|jgi:hypothetical protein|nr:hypothetical protein [Solirubrobacterales bacterium]MDX6652408.1 hypothetical protein [Solirubrobacterales bacterium]MDX6663760.1 hypothetical protein [Solirubrobacterales bacterium]